MDMSSPIQLKICSELAIAFKDVQPVDLGPGLLRHRNIRSTLAYPIISGVSLGEAEAKMILTKESLARNPMSIKVAGLSMRRNHYQPRSALKPLQFDPWEDFPFSEVG